jgi:hypothetical protein
VQRRPKEGLETEESRLRQTPSMVARLLFPPASALVPDRPQVLVPLPGRTGAVAMLPNLGVPPRRNHGLGPALGQHVVTESLVIGPIGTDLVDLSGHLLQLAPAVLAHFPLALAVDLEPAGIDHQGQRRRARQRPQGHVHLGGTARPGTVAGHGQGHGQQRKQRAGQAFGGAQGQVVDGAQRQHALDGGIGVDVLRAPLRGAGLAPTANRFFINPQRKAAAGNQRSVIGGPVTDAVGRLLFHAGDVSGLAIGATTPGAAQKINFSGRTI